jgi:phosphoribosylaminoimidazole carboxylase/phosphoribosylaminoimidazole-succinocarboxamide synthase
LFYKKEESEVTHQHLTKGVILAEGKTKRIVEIIGKPNLVLMEAKDDLTAGDGAKHDTFPNKGVLSTATTAAVFELLNACGIPTAYKERYGDTGIIAESCEMLPYEVVWRRVAPPKSSYLKRKPHIEPGTRFNTAVVEFFLKTTSKDFRGITVPKDDPLITSFGPAGVTVVRPDLPGDVEPVHIPGDVLYGKDNDVGHPMAEMEKIIRRVGLVYESAWQQQGCQLLDFKIEFGITKNGRLVVADVIDNDSGRVFDAAGNHLDKQRYRDGASLEEVAALYADVAARVQRFADLYAKPRIILWCASEKDDPAPFAKAIMEFGSPANLEFPVGSVHKHPEWCLRTIRKLIADGPANVVVIAYVGRSNGAGPVFAADTNVPVITVPASVGSFPEDVWSSLRTPSETPLSVILEPANAVLAALNILSLKSPHAYLAARSLVENRHLDQSNSPTYGR